MARLKLLFACLLCLLFSFALSGCETHNSDSDAASPPVTPVNTSADPSIPVYSPSNPDWDNDGINNPADNCQRVANANQSDTDGDGIGDVCDLNIDTDNDGLDDGIDICPAVANPNQLDQDHDGKGNLCDADQDGDGISDNGTNPDNCPLVANPNQKDTDGDGIGDACETDGDGDGIADVNDNCPIATNPNQADMDNDNMGDVCDTDKDADGVDNTQDSCPATPGQQANGCPSTTPTTPPANPQGDDDGDGITNGLDNCPYDVNANQKDNDGDGVGDVCDTDNDNDSVTNNLDNCPLTANTNQKDADGDGVGDSCDTNFSCLPNGTLYKPLTGTTNYAATDSHSALCLGCDITDTGNVINGQPASFATANIPASLGLLNSPHLDLNVNAISSAGKTSMKSVKTLGFVISNPTNATIGLSALGNGLVISLLDGSGTIVATSNTNNASPLALDLLGSGAGQTKQRFLAVSANGGTLPDFETAQLKFQTKTLLGILGLGANVKFRIHRLCIAK